MLLSVLSALARQDVDPWDEAAKLAQLPGEAATKRLASLIAALPDEPWAHSGAGTIAVRLIALLPRRGRSNIASRDTSLTVGAVINSRAVVTCVIFMTFMLVAQFLITSHHPPQKAYIAHAAASSAGLPPMPMPSSGQ